MATKVPKYQQPKKKKTTKYDPAKQVEGLKKRLEASGVDAEKATDGRNFVERLLNLPDDQNLLFDIFEIINRPQNALFGGIAEAQKGGDFVKGLKEGITGRKDTSFKEILHNMDVEDSKEKFGIDDVLGFAGDVLLDPVDLALIPVSGGANVAANVAQTAEKTAKTVNTVSDVAKTTKYISPLTLAGKGVKKGVKGTFKLADNGITRVLSKIDAMDAAKITKNGLDGVRDALQLATKYTDFKKSMTSIFNAAKALPQGAWDSAKKLLGSEKLSTAQLKVLEKELYGKIDDIAAKLGKTSEEVGKELTDLIEYTYYKPKGTLRGILENSDQALNREVARVLRDSGLFASLGMDFNDVYKKVTLENGVKAWIVNDDEAHRTFLNKLKANEDKVMESLIKEKPALADFLDVDIDMPRFYSNKDVTRYNELLANPEFKQLFDEAYSTQQRMLELIDAAFDGQTKFSKATPEGFLHHTATDEYRAVPKDIKDYIGSTSGSDFAGNMKKFTERKYKLSTKEANQIAKAQIENTLKNNPHLPPKVKKFWQDNNNIKMFEETLQASIGDFIADAPKFAKHTKMLDEVLAKSIVENDGLIMTPPEGMKKVPSGYVEVAYNDIKHKLTSAARYVQNPDALKKAAKELPQSRTLLIDKNVFNMVGNLGKTQEVGKFLRFVDTINTSFKKFKLLSPGFQMRNVLGNTTNMYLAGVPIDDVIKNMKYADEVLRKGDDLLAKVAKGEVLVGKEKELYDVYEKFVRSGFHDASRVLHDIDQFKEATKGVGKIKEAGNKVVEFNAAANEAMDKRFRLSLMLYGDKSPEILQKVGVGNSSELVRKVLFDPYDLSATEAEIFKKVVPFYTFAKKNLAFQMSNLPDNAKKYKNLQKTLNALWTSSGVDIEDVDNYKLNNMWIPIPGLTKDGKYTALKANLPVSDLAEFFENPLQRVVSSLSPAIRAPFEMATNKQIFSDMPISEFKGQQGYAIPEVDRRTEYLLSQLGLDVPVAGAMDIGRTAVQGVRGDLQGQSVLDIFNQAMGRSLISRGDVEKTRISKAYDELREIEDVIKYYKQEGVDLVKLSDINKNQNNTLKALQARLQSLSR